MLQSLTLPLFESSSEPNCRNASKSSGSDFYRVEQGDAIEKMKEMADQCVHLVVTDPPYFIDGMGTDWQHRALMKKVEKAGVVGSLPVGMKFDPEQGRKFQRFMTEVSQEVIRVLKPGGFFICFSQARLYHRLAVAAEEVGFEIRDMLGWKYNGQAKAFTQDHFVRKMNLPEQEKERLIMDMRGRKTPQLKPQIEPMILAQKPKDGTFVENWSKHRTGLIDTSISMDGGFPGNIIECKKPSTKERGESNEHLTVKPVRLIRHLIEIFSLPGQVVFDPFVGSGSHGVAALQVGRSFLGFDIEPKYVHLARTRLAAAESTPVKRLGI